MDTLGWCIEYVWFVKLKGAGYFAANPEMRLELTNPETRFRQNVYAAHVLLEAISEESDF